MTKSLKGLRVLNTRPHNQARLLNQSIREAGGVAVECPTLEIEPTSERWIETLPKLDNVNYAIFVSPNAVIYCFNALARQNISWPASIQVIAIGQGTVKALNKFNIKVHYTPEYPDSEHVLSLNPLQQLKNHTVVLFKGEGGRKLIEDVLLLRGAQIVNIHVYRRILPKIDPEFLNSIWQKDLVDIILLTSEQSINNLFELFGKDAHSWLQNKPCLVISERLAKSASSFGIKHIIISHPDRIMDALFDYYQGLADGQ